MEINIVAVLVATVAMFIVGAFWYMILFGKEWGKIHGFDRYSKTEQDAMRSQMTPFYVVQLIVTFVSAWMLAHFIAVQPSVTFYEIAFWLWLGFILPTQVSAVIFGGTEGKFIAQKIAIMAGGSLVCTIAGAWVISLF